MKHENVSSPLKEESALLLSGLERLSQPLLCRHIRASQTSDRAYASVCAATAGWNVAAQKALGGSWCIHLDFEFSSKVFRGKVLKTLIRKDIL